LGAVEIQSTTLAANNTSTTFSTSAQNVTLTANVTSAAGSVNEGTVTFTLKQGTTTIGSATTSGTVSNGAASVTYALPAGTPAGSYTIDAVYTPGPDFAASSDTTHTLSVNAATTTTAANNTSTTFSTSAQNVTLTANVTSSGGTVNQGTVTFTLKQGTTTIGSATTSGTVTSGLASVSYALPANLAAGSYTIDAVYNPGSDFVGSSDSTHTLSVGTTATTLTASNASGIYSTSGQNVTLTANVSSSAGAVNEGTVTFTLKHGTTIIGSATTSVTVSNGTASVSYALPPATAAGSYTIDAVYNPGPNFLGSSDSSHTLTLASAASTVAVGDAAVIFNANPQTVTLTANVTSSGGTVNQGSMTFTLWQGDTVVGTATSATVANGKASVTYTLPAGTAPGSYVIQASYHDSANNFADGSGTAALNVNAAATTVQLTQMNIVPNLLNGTAEVTLTAQVGSPAGIVNEGGVTFNFAGHSGQGAVQNGTASVQFIVPLMTVNSDQSVSLAYADAAAPARFNGSGGATAAVLNPWNMLASSNITFTSNGVQSTQSSQFSLAQFVYVNQRITELRFGSLSVDVGYLKVNGDTVVTLNGVPWLILIYGPQGQFLGAVPLAS
jgi:hypothetical protein